jgi:thioredoxin reductase
VPKQHLRSQLAEKLGCKLTETGLIKVHDFNETRVKGVFAAGDVTAKMQSIAVAVSQRAITAGPGINYVFSQEDFA